jgi:peptidyl-prolyl cis-trans isomerase D
VLLRSGLAKSAQALCKNMDIVSMSSTRRTRVRLFNFDGLLFTMFDFVRKHTKALQFVLFLLIFPSFVMFGIEGYSRFGDQSESVAEVAGKSINKDEWDAAHKQESDRLRASMPNVDASLLDAPQLRRATLDRLLRERVLAAAVQDAHLNVSEQRLAQEVQSNPSIAALKKPDGRFDTAALAQQLGMSGLSPEQFLARLQNDLSSRQVLQSVGLSSLAPTALADRGLNAFFEQRELQVIKFKAADFAKQVEIKPTDLDAFYQKTQDRYLTQELAQIEYVQLDMEQVRKTVSVSEADLKAYYEQNTARLSGGAEERRASHILIQAPRSASVAERDAARAKAQALLVQVRKTPASFAEIAKKNSQDTGSAMQGGDLSFFARDAMVKPFSDAAFAMKKSDISELVESDFGFHIIQLTDIKTPKQRSFAEQKNEIEVEVKKQLAQKKFAELAEIFTNTVYEQADSLKPVADKLKLEVRAAQGLTRQGGAAAAGAPVLANPKLLTALFAPDSTQNKRNTAAIELAPNQLIAARVTQYQAAKVQALTGVKERVQQAFVAERSVELAQAQGEATLAEVKAKPDAAAWPAALTIARDRDEKLGKQIVDAALQAAPNGLPLVVGVHLGAEGYAVLRVNKVLPRIVVDAPKQAQERQQFAQAVANAEVLAYYKTLQTRFKAAVKNGK